MTRDEDFMQEVVRLAVANVQAGRGGPFAALVVKGGRVIGSGANVVTSENDPTAHAEVVAIREACRTLGDFKLSGCELYTTCEPCPMCLGAIYWARLEQVVYGCTRDDAARAGFDDAFIYQAICQPIEERTLPMRELSRNEALKTFEAWKRKADRLEY